MQIGGVSLGVGLVVLSGVVRVAGRPVERLLYRTFGIDGATSSLEQPSREFTGPDRYAFRVVRRTYAWVTQYSISQLNRWLYLALGVLILSDIGSTWVLLRIAPPLCFSEAEPIARWWLRNGGFGLLLVGDALELLLLWVLQRLYTWAFVDDYLGLVIPVIAIGGFGYVVATNILVAVTTPCASWPLSPGL